MKRPDNPGDRRIWRFYYRGFTLVAYGPHHVVIRNDASILDKVIMPGKGLFRTMREAMRRVREEGHDLALKVHSVKADKARRILEQRLGGVSRPPGECLTLADDEAIGMLVRWGWQWTGTHWHDAVLQQAIRDKERDLDIPEGTLPARFIWEDDDR